MVRSEKVKVKVDESVRIEFSLPKAEMEILNKAKELLGHIRPGMSIKELVVLMAERVVRAKESGRAVWRKNKENGACEQESQFSASSNSAKELKSDEAEACKVPTRVNALIRRQVFQRDQCCQWRNPATGNKCGSRHLLELDHKVPQWAGGNHKIENLELKCRVHNQWKYQLEAGIRASGIRFALSVPGSCNG